MKRLALVAVLAIALVWCLRDLVTVSKPVEVSAGSASGLVDHIKTLKADERRDVAGRIASAQASHTATPRPSLPPITAIPTTPALDSHDPVSMKQTLRAAMHEVIVHITGCYEASFSTRGHKALMLVAHLTLTGDPDIGTLIDAPQLKDTSGKPLPDALDDCLRDTFQSLELPPLAEGDHMVVDWPFTFRPAADDSQYVENEGSNVGSDDDADDGSDDDNEL
jgi:hypothetical protein